jgi:hypothetical protein
LLREQVAKTGGGLDRPAPIVELAGPTQKLIALVFGCSYFHLGQFSFIVVNSDSGV